MNKDQVEGSVKDGYGRVESKVGSLFGDSTAQARGASNQIEGSLQDIYGRAVDHANKVVSEVDQLVSDRTYAALGATLVAGLVIGLLLGRGGTRVVYVRK